MNYIKMSPLTGMVGYGGGATGITIGGGSGPILWYGDRGVNSMNNGTNVLDYIDITTPGNATDFGDFVVQRESAA